MVSIAHRCVRVYLVLSKSPLQSYKQQIEAMGDRNLSVSNCITDELAIRDGTERFYEFRAEGDL